MIRVGAAVSQWEKKKRKTHSAKTVMFKAEWLSLQEHQDPDKRRQHETRKGTMAQSQPTVVGKGEQKIKKRRIESILYKNVIQPFRPLQRIITVVC